VNASGNYLPTVESLPIREIGRIASTTFKGNCPPYKFVFQDTVDGLKKQHFGVLEPHKWFATKHICGIENQI